jgi:hypothetical protein
MKQTHTLIICVLFALSATVKARTEDTLSFEDRIYAQINAFPQEKIYLHTDRTVYAPGEKIWYRAYVVNALMHIPSHASRYVYVELTDPAGELISRDKIRPDRDGLFHNNISLDTDMAEGYYLIRAYTHFMRNRPDYFFEKKIFITAPAFSEINLKPRFTVSEKKGRVTLDFQDGAGEKLQVEKLYVRTNNETVEPQDAKNTFSFAVTPGQQQFLNVTFESGGRKFRQYIRVPGQDADFDVSFFPEGGSLVPGEVCTVGFKALKKNGLSEDVTGAVLNEKGDTVAYLESGHAGMGTFSLRPEKDVKYSAVCRDSQGNERRFPIPAANPEACALKAFRHRDKLYITVLKGSEFKERPLHVAVHTRGAVIYGGTFPEQNVLAINTRPIPSGVCQILLLDEELNPLSERLFFHLNEEEPAYAVISTGKPEYAKREYVTAQVKITDAQGTPLAGNFSVSVTDDGDILPDSLSSSVASSLLLCSDIRGYVESPGYYLENPDAADALMLTQGWKRYDIPAVLKGDIEKPVHYLEAGQEISGKLKGMLTGKAKKKNQVILIAVNNGFLKETETDAEGRFVFSGFEFPDSTLYVVQAKGKRGGTYMELALDEETFPETEPFTVPEHERERAGTLENYVKKSELKYADDNGGKSILLEGITVTAARPRPKSKFSSPGNSYIFPDEYLHIKGFDFERALRLLPRIQTVSGVALVNAFGVRDSKKKLVAPTYIIDDWILYDMDSRDLKDLDITDIESIELIEPQYVQLSMLPAGIEAAILITTRKKTYGKGRKIKFNIKAVRPAGYRAAAEFYSPKYETEEERGRGTDRRTTIFWKPDVVLNAGEAEFDFYTADTETTYSVIIEGIADNGQIIRKTEKIRVNGGTERDV